MFVVIRKYGVTCFYFFIFETQYFAIVKAEFTESSFSDKPTAVDATVGYAIKKGDHIPRPPRHENATDEEHMEFSMKHQKLIKEFPKQSSIEDSYDFIVDAKNPFYIKFPFVVEEPGQYTRQFYRTTHIFEGPSGSAMGGLVVVEKFSKAVDENSVCKNEDFRRLIKHDYSTVACVDSETAWKLIANKCEPDIDVNIESLVIENKQIFVIKIKEGTHKPYLLTGKSTYKRVMKDDYVLTRRDFDEFYSKRNQNSGLSGFSM